MKGSRIRNEEREKNKTKGEEDKTKHSSSTFIVYTCETVMNTFSHSELVKEKMIILINFIGVVEISFTACQL